MQDVLFIQHIIIFHIQSMVPELYLLNRMKLSLLFFACILTTGISMSPAFLPAQIIAAGGYHSLAVCNDGTVNAWGRNANGQLGNGNNTNSNVPVEVSYLHRDIAAAGGRDHSLALRNDGTVWSWGYNSTGQLGNGTLISSNIPVQVTGLTGVIAVAARRGWHSLALKSNGTVWAWGGGGQGQLGNGTNTDSPVPVQVNSLTGIVAIDGGYFHCLALKNDGTVWSWGNNQFGQLGNGCGL